MKNPEMQEERVDKNAGVERSEEKRGERDGGVEKREV